LSGARALVPSFGMTLSSKLNDVLLILGCPHCGREQSKKGSWLKAMRRFFCDACGREAQITYEEKLKIFDNHYGPGTRPKPQAIVAVPRPTGKTWL
jgi:hypothetical protein